MSLVKRKRFDLGVKPSSCYLQVARDLRAKPNNRDSLYKYFFISLILRKSIQNHNNRQSSRAFVNALWATRRRSGGNTTGDRYLWVGQLSIAVKSAGRTMPGALEDDYAHRPPRSGCSVSTHWHSNDLLTRWSLASGNLRRGKFFISPICSMNIALKQAPFVCCY